MPARQNAVLIIKGDRFLQGAKVWMKKDNLEIMPKRIIVKNSKEIEVLFDFTEQPIGVYDVIVKNPNNKEMIKNKDLISNFLK